MIPDPTTAIRDALPEIFDSNERLTAKEFVESLGESLPVLDGGKYRKYIEEYRKGEDPDPKQLSEATSDALRRLESEKRLIIETKDDFDADSFRRFSNGKHFTHVTPSRRSRRSD